MSKKENNKEYLHECKICNYKTNDASNIAKHNKSKKHIEKELLVGKIKKVQKFKCQYCQSVYNYKRNLDRHTKKCNMKETLIDEKIKNIKLEVELKSMKTNNEMLVETNKFLKDVVTKTGNMAFKTVNALTLLSTHFTENKNILEPLKPERVKEILNEDKTVVENNKKFPDEKQFHLAEHIIYHHRHDSLTNYLGKIIVKEYKKKNPVKQVMWIADASRLIYVVKTDIQDANIWIYDEKGVKVTEFIIDPIYDVIRDVIKKYTKEMPEYTLEKHTHSIQELKQNTLLDGHDLLKKIKAKIVQKDLLRVIAPDFSINKLREILERKKIKYSNIMDFEKENFDMINVLTMCDSSDS